MSKEGGGRNPPKQSAVTPAGPHVNPEWSGELNVSAAAMRMAESVSTCFYLSEMITNCLGVIISDSGGGQAAA